MKKPCENSDVEQKGAGRVATRRGGAGPNWVAGRQGRLGEGRQAL